MRGEAVGAVLVWRHPEDVGRGPARGGDGGREDGREVRPARPEPRHDRLVLLGLKRAGRVDEDPPGPHQCRGRLEDARLSGNEGCEVAGLPTPLAVGVAPEDAKVRAGSIDQDAVARRPEVLGEGVRIGQARLDDLGPEAGARRPEKLQPGRVSGRQRRSGPDWP